MSAPKLLFQPISAHVRYASRFRASTTPAGNRRLSVWSRCSGEPTGVKRGPLVGPVTMTIWKLPGFKYGVSCPALRQYSFAAASHTMSRDPETASYKFNHTMIRIKDPKPSLRFYCDVLGMELLTENHYSDFSLYFLAYNHEGRKLTKEDVENLRYGREGILELTHNHGTESDPNFKYSSGNSDPRGFGHIAITVDNVDEACARFERLGVTFQKKLSDGKMRHIAFILDPDGYWVEVLPGPRK